MLRDRNLNENENFESVEVKCTADDDINLNETNPAIEPAKVFEIWNRFLFAKQIILRRQQLLTISQLPKLAPEILANE